MTKPVPGPNPNPTKPRIIIPTGACDCHSHIVGPTDRFPFVLEPNYTPPNAPLEDYLVLLNSLELTRAIIVQPSFYGTDNLCSEDAISRMDGRARGVAVIDPEIAEKEVARLNEAGFCGTRLNLINSSGNTRLDDLEKIANKIAPFDWHIQLFLHGRLLPDLISRLLDLPVEITIDHLGLMDPGQGIEQPGFQALLKLVVAGRCWVKLCPYRFDLTGYPYAKAQPLARALYKAAPERMLWGTDWPHPDVPGQNPGEAGLMPNDGDLLNALGIWFEEEADVHRILVDNPARLYGFD